MNAVRHDRELGAGKLGGIIFLIIVIAAIYACVKIFPAYYDNYQLQDAMETEARFALNNRGSATEVQDDVFKEVLKIGVPVDKKDIIVRFPDRSQGMGGAVEIDVAYGVDVAFPNYVLHLNFHPHADNHSI